MRFRLWTILWVFALFASAMAVFPLYGFFVAIVVLQFWILVLKDSETTLVEIFVLVAISGVLVGLMLPAAMRSREAERVTQCRGMLSQVAAALLAYKDQKGSLPPAKTQGGSGQAMHSWRLSLLPFLEKEALFSKYDISRPWSDDANKSVASTRLPVYSCRNDDPTLCKSGFVTSYFAVVGPGTAWSSLSSGNGKFTDDPSKTILLVEALGKGVAWTEPIDLTFDDALKLLTTTMIPAEPGHMSWGKTGFFDKPHPKELAANYRGYNVGFADGSVRYVSVPISKDLAVALLTANGGEQITDAEFERFWRAELSLKRIYSFSIFVLISLLPLLKVWEKIRNRAAL